MKTFLALILSFFSLNAPVNPPSVATLGFMGDLGLGRYITTVARNKNDFSWSFQKIDPWLKENDLNVANLESPIIKDCPPGVDGTFIFCGDTKFIPYLQHYKFVFNLNNNHILNYGQDGLAQTRNFLPDSVYFDNFLIKEINGLKFGFLGYDFVTYPHLDSSQIISRIKSVRPQVDYLIVSLHWGNEYLLKPDTRQVELAHQLVDAGVDVIHGHHSHVFQPPEIYHGKYIFYSLGNFIFDQPWSVATSHSQIVRLTFTKDSIKDYQLFPIEIKFASQPLLSP